MDNWKMQQWKNEEMTNPEISKSPNHIFHREKPMVEKNAKLDK